MTKENKTQTKMKTNKKQTHTPQRNNHPQTKQKTRKQYCNAIMHSHKWENSVGLDNPHNVKANPILSSSFRHLQLLLMPKEFWSSVPQRCTFSKY